jgi:hypothetical protein
MPLTTIQFRVILDRRVGPWSALGDFDDAVAYALTSVGSPPLDATAIVDADLVSVPADQANQLKDVAEWRYVLTCAANTGEDELRRIGLMDDPAKLYAKLVARAECLQEYLRRTYGFGLTSITTGTVDMHFQQTDGPGTFGF